MAIDQRGMMIQHLANTLYFRRSAEQLASPLSEEELREELRALNDDWRTPGDMKVDEEILREARVRALNRYDSS